MIRPALARLPFGLRRCRTAPTGSILLSNFYFYFYTPRSLHTTVLAEDSARSSPASRSKFQAILFVAGLAILWFILCRQLSYEWAANEQYNYGWFVPFFAIFLFWLRWEEWSGGQRSEAGGQRSEIRSRNRSSRQNALTSEVAFVPSDPAGDTPASTPTAVLCLLSSVLLLLLFPVRLFEVANPDWRPLSWVHALIVVSLTLLAIWFWGGKSALWHFAFPICFVLVAVPWITPIEAPLVQGLMRLVASVATETLTLFGIPAQLEGSLIRVSNGVVGVSEACSGVRSLQTSIMIGLLFGELKRLTIARRFALVGAALAIALFANFARAFFLVWIAATQNLAAVERWHDIAGYAIVGTVFLGTVAIAAWLAKAQRSEGRSQRAAGSEERADSHPHRFFSVSVFSVSAFLYLLFVEAGVEGWYRWHERNFVESTGWTVRWPESAPGFHELPIDDNVRSTLRYDAGREAAWPASFSSLPNDSAASPANCTMFFFRWKPGSASILRARAHRPDICLPNTGWRTTHDDGMRTYAASPALALPFRHFGFVRDVGNGRQIFAQAFFCQREDRVPPAGPDRFDATAGRTGNWMRDDRVRVVREGLRNQGQQVMELVLLTPNRIDQQEAEAEFAKLVPKLVVQDAAVTDAKQRPGFQTLKH